MSDIRTNVIALLEETGAAHHKAFESVDGADEDWPLWYARFAQHRLNEILPAKISESLLVYALVKADKGFKVEQPESAWQVYYADLLLSEFSGS